MRIKSILNIAKIIPPDVRSTTSKLTGAIKSGYTTGKRCKRIYGKNKTLLPLGPHTKSIRKELGKLKFEQDEMPALAASITYLIPIPSPIPLTPIVYGLGHIINRAIKIFK